jgi:hypothetical protein
MIWTWRYEDSAGTALDRPTPERFTNKSDAESWLGEAWRDLLDSGVHQVTLLEDDRVEYGPMGLNP